MTKLRTWHEVLCSYSKRQNSDFIKKYYDQWRQEYGLPLHRCDNEHCVYYLQELNWIGSPLPLILDHVNGNCSDNTPGNLRYLCPNCDSQSCETRGGANIGRKKQYDDNNYVIIRRKGTMHYYFHGFTGGVGGCTAKISFTKV